MAVLLQPTSRAMGSICWGRMPAAALCTAALPA